MAITKTTEEDKITVIGDTKKINIRTATVIKEDGVELTRSFHRRFIVSRQGSYDGSSWTHADTDISGESTEVQAIANAVWTSEVKALQDAENAQLPE
jgi:hypothetical protein